jgi:hypothetical protein
MEQREYPYYTPEVNELFAALSQAQAKFKEAELDEQANYGPYASFESLSKATKEALAEFGLSIKQDPGYAGDANALFTTLAHKSGQYSISCMILRTAGPDMQKLGAALTYGRRYAYAAILGIADAKDDDGESNAQSFQKQEPKEYPKDLGTGAPTEGQINMIKNIGKFNAAIFKIVAGELNITDLNQLNKTTASNFISRAKELESK